MIIIKQTPIVYPSCSVAIKLRFEKIEEGNKNLRISFVGADGKLDRYNEQLPSPSKIA